MSKPNIICGADRYECQTLEEMNLHYQLEHPNTQTDLSNPTEPTYPQFLSEERALDALQATPDRTKTEALAGKPKEELEEQLYKIFNNLWANRTNPNISRSDAYKHARQDVTKLIARIIELKEIV